MAGFSIPRGWRQPVDYLQTMIKVFKLWSTQKKKSSSQLKPANQLLHGAS